MMRLLLAASLLVVIIGTWLMPLPEDKIVFLDVGQGDAILLQHHTYQVLIDGGQSNTVLTELARELPWFDRTIDVLIVTHPQRDHIEGLLHVLENYDVRLVLLPAAPHTSQLQATWLTMLQQRHIPYRFAWFGQRLTLGEMMLSIVGPIDSDAARAAARADLNNASTIARADFNDLSILLTGDAEARTEKQLLAHAGAELLDVDVLKVGHHGSNSSTTAELIAATSPRLAAISVGANNQFGHPHPDVLNRLNDIPLFRTDQHGPITLRHHHGRWHLPQALLH